MSNGKYASSSNPKTNPGGVIRAWERSRERAAAGPLGEDAPGDSTHPGTGTQSTQVGDTASASGNYTVAFGHDALAENTSNTALGAFAKAQNSYGNTAVGYDAVADTGHYSTALGSDALARGTNTVALGGQAQATADGAIAIGEGAVNSVGDRALVKANDLELIRSAATGTGTSIILADTVTGTRYRLSIASGALTVALA